MRAFCTNGWEYFEKCQEIMFSSTACGSHIYHPTTAMPPIFQNETDEDSTMAVEAVAPKVVTNNVQPVVDNQSITTGSAADHATLVMGKPSASAPGKRPHSLMMTDSNPQLLSTSLTPTSNSTLIMTPESNLPAKK
jgi:hypothetical protein